MNKAWSENMDLGQWICYDEQMVKCLSTYAHYLQRFNKDKPIKSGEQFVVSALRISTATDSSSCHCDMLANTPRRTKPHPLTVL